MNVRKKNTRLTPLRREEMAVAVLRRTLSKARPATLHGVSLKIVSPLDRAVQSIQSYGDDGSLITSRSSGGNG